MKSDILLKKLLDGTLTDAEKSDVHARMMISADFADEAQEMMEIEELLHQHDVFYAEESNVFLRRVENTVADIIQRSGTAGVVAKFLKTRLGIEGQRSLRNGLIHFVSLSTVFFTVTTDININEASVTTEHLRVADAPSYDAGNSLTAAVATPNNANAVGGERRARGGRNGDRLSRRFGNDATGETFTGHSLR